MLGLSLDKLTWSEFAESFVWNQGEHVVLIGPTGQGKTALAVELLERRRYVSVFACKPSDPLIDELVMDRNYFLTETWPPPAPRERFPRIVFWPRIERMSDTVTQRLAFKLAMEDVYRQGKWCVYLDECRYVTDTLKLTSQAHLLWLQGRSLKISFIVGTQRPFWIPQEAFDQSTHMFIWRENDRRNLQRYGEFSSDPDDLKATLQSLPACTSCPPTEVCTCGRRGHFVYLNTRTGEMVVSRLELEERIAA